MAGEVIRITQTAPPKSTLILGLECALLLPTVTSLAYSIFGAWIAACSLLIHILLIYSQRHKRYRLANPVSICIDDDLIWACIGNATLWSIDKINLASVEVVKPKGFFRFQSEMLILHTKNNDSFSIYSSDQFDQALTPWLHTSADCKL